MTKLRSSGTPLFTGDTRRRVAWRTQPGKTSLRVPVWHANEKGEWLEGLLRLPERLCHAAPHSNAALERDKLITSNINRWAEYRAQRGWDMVSPPKITGPFDPPVSGPGQLPSLDDLGMKHYHVMARFKRRFPMFVGLDDMLEMNRVADLHQIQPEADPLPWNDTTGTYDSGWIDPLKERQEHYATTGIKQSDYHNPDAWEATFAD